MKTASDLKFFVEQSGEEPYFFTRDTMKFSSVYFDKQTGARRFEKGKGLAVKNPHLSPSWPGKLEKKIDIFLNGNYFASSNAYKRCRDAVAGTKWTHNLKADDKSVKAYFAAK